MVEAAEVAEVEPGAAEVEAVAAEENPQLSRAVNILIHSLGNEKERLNTL